MTNPVELPDVAQGLLAAARDNEQFEVCLSRSRSTTVKAYQGEVESVRSGASQAVGVRIVVDGQQGFATAGSLDREVLNQVVKEARENLQFAESDPHQGIAAPDGVVPPGLDLTDDAVLRLSEEDRADVAIELERRCLSADSRITGVRSSAWSDGWGEFALASTSGIAVHSEGATPATRLGGQTR